MSGAKDPDEFIKTKGADAFRNLLEASENQVDYRLRSVTDKYDLSVDEQKVEFLKEATDLVSRLPGPVERQVYAMRVASMAGVGADAVTAEVERRRKRMLRNARREDERQQSRPERRSQPVERAFRYEDPASAAAEEGIIRLLYLEPALGSSPALPEPEEFSAPVLGHLYSVIRTRLREGASVSTAVLGEELNQEEMSLLVRLLQKPEQLKQGEKALDDYIEKIREQKELRPRTDLQPTDLLSIAAKQKERKGFKG